MIRHIEAASDIYDFWNTRSINFERLQGYDNRFSFRLNRQYRLEVEIEWKDKEQR